MSVVDWEWLKCWRGIAHRFDGKWPHGCRLCGLAADAECHSPVPALRRAFGLDAEGTP